MMATRLGGVEIPITLDTSKALQQLDTLEKKLDKDESKAKATTKAAQNAVANVNVANKMKAGGGNNAGGGLRPSGSQSAASKLASFAQGRTPIGGLAGGAARAASGLLPESALGAVKFAGAATAGYGVASLLAQKLPELSYALSKINGLEGQMKGLQAGLEGVRRGFSTFETGITELPKTAREVRDLTELSLRLGGGMPAVGDIFRATHMANVYTTELDKKFNQFKNKEVYAAAGEDFRRYMERTGNAMQKSFGMKAAN
jgi:hypothetical protein